VRRHVERDAYTTEVAMAPAFGQIDYAHPEKYVAPNAGAGNPARLATIVGQLGGQSDDDKLLSISRWLHDHVRQHDDGTRYHWRSTDDLLDEGTVSGCADFALLYGSLARAAGIATVWVQTMDPNWIREFARLGEHVSSFRGHVFLEVFVRQKWALLNPTEAMLYDDYDPRQHLLPGDYWAYDKGSDPSAMVLSSRGAAWRAQLSRAFEGFDVSRLPVAPGHPLDQREVSAPSHALSGPLFIVARAPFQEALAKRCADAGADVRRSFDRDFGRNLALAHGGILVIAVAGDDMVLPESYWPSETVVSLDELRAQEHDNPRGVFRRKRHDGTAVYVLYGSDAPMLESVIKTFPPG
jgi:hypothetical protein